MRDKLGIEPGHLAQIMPLWYGKGMKYLQSEQNTAPLDVKISHRMSRDRVRRVLNFTSSPLIHNVVTYPEVSFRSFVHSVLKELKVNARLQLSYGVSV